MFVRMWMDLISCSLLSLGNHSIRAALNFSLYLLYFGQKNGWSDTTSFKEWFTENFPPLMQDNINTCGFVSGQLGSTFVSFGGQSWSGDYVTIAVKLYFETSAERNGV